MRRRFGIWGSIVWLVTVMPTVARAQGNPAVANAASAEATVLRIEPTSDLVVDTSLARGATSGDEFVLYRPITVHHPVTGRALRDRFRIGVVRVTESGVALSLVRPVGRLEREPEVGDILVPVAIATARTSPAQPVTQPIASAPARARRPAPVAPPAANPAPVPVVEAASPAPAPAPAPVVNVVASGTTLEERAAIGAWLAAMERTPETRIAVYRAYLREHPQSPFTETVLREIESLTAIDRGLRTHVPPPDPTTRTPAATAPVIPALRGDIAHSLRTGDPLVIALQLSDRTPLSGAILHVRHHDDATFTSIRLEPQAGGFLRARVDHEMIEPPGLEYFVEVVTPSGRAVPAIGSAELPVHIVVTEAGSPPARITGLTRIDLRTEYADVGTGSANPEHFLRIEGDFLQRVEIGPLYGYRVGFGGYDGVGQPLCAYADSHTTCRNGLPAPSPTHATAVYAFHELEFAASDFVHFMARFEIGVTDAGVAFGVGTSMRVGRERGTNIVFGGHLFNGIGQKAFFSFMFYPLRRFSMMTEAEIFNQEIDGGDPMFRFVEQVGYRVTTSVRLSLRGSYQLRNMTHGGFGGGAAATFDW